MRLASAALVLAACSSPPARGPDRSSGPEPARSWAMLPELGALHDVWIDAVEARDPARIAALLEPPFSVYYDDGVTSVPSPACTRWRRTTVRITKPAERDQLAACIASSVRHATVSSQHPFDRGDPTHPIGIVTPDVLRNLVDEPVRDAVAPLAEDHAFVHGAPMFASDFDFTLAIANDDPRIDFVGVSAHPGC